MELIRGAFAPHNYSKPRIELRVERTMLSRRRWRALAVDGSDFGFDLEQPLQDGAIFFETETAVYAIVQQPEDLYEISPGDSVRAARIGWMIGNLHFPISIDDGALCAPADPAVHQLLERERIEFAAVKKVFHPLKAVGGHHHHGH